MLKYRNFFWMLGFAITTTAVVAFASACSSTDACGPEQHVALDKIVQPNDRLYYLTTPASDKAILSKACKATFIMKFGYVDDSMQKTATLTQGDVFPLDGLQNKSLFHVDNDGFVFSDWDTGEFERGNGSGVYDIVIRLSDHGDHQGMAADGKGIFYIKTGLKAGADDPIKISGEIRYYSGPLPH